MMGALGVGGNLNHWSEEELETAKQMVSLYKEIRPLVQEGNLYRILSPRTSEMTAVEYASKNGSEAVLFAFLHSSQLGAGSKIVYLRGLKDTALYKIDNSEESVSGAALMKRGLEVNLKGDFDSKLIRIRKV
jgi:alpha-galactosidase